MQFKTHLERSGIIILWKTSNIVYTFFILLFVFYWIQKVKNKQTSLHRNKNTSPKTMRVTKKKKKKKSLQSLNH